jgi:uncharacterized membrane protein
MAETSFLGEIFWGRLIGLIFLAPRHGDDGDALGRRAHVRVRAGDQHDGREQGCARE